MSCGRQCYGLPFRYGHDSCLIVASAPLTPLRAAVPFACSHRLGGSTSCSSRQPHKPKLLPFAASVAPWAFSPPQTRLPQLHRECPALRGLTTTFRSVGQTTLPCLQCRLLAPLQSVVRSPNRTSNTIAGRLHENKGLLCRSRSRRLSPTKRLFRSPTRPIPAAPPRKEASEVPEPVEGPTIVRTIAR